MRTFRITGDYEEVDEAFGSSTDVRERERLQAIRMGMSGQYSIVEIAEALGRGRATVWQWADKFRKGGLAGLLERKTAPGNKGQFGPEVVEEITEGLKEGRWKRAKEIRAWLETTHSVKLSLKGVYYWLGKLGGVLKVPRKTHAKKDAAAAVEFKAELSGRLKELNIPEGKPVRIWMEDEHRYGLITVLRKVWTLPGCKPVSPYQTRYQWGVCLRSPGGRRKRCHGIFVQPDSKHRSKRSIFAADSRERQRVRTCGDLGRGRLPSKAWGASDTRAHPPSSVASIQPGTQPGGKALGSAQR